MLKKLIRDYCKIKISYYKLATIISPVLNTKIRYKAAFGKKINLNNPITFNEKIQWLKLNKYMNDPLVIQCADKLLVRDYVEKVIGNRFLNDLIAVYKSPDEIVWKDLPEKFVLKWNFGAGANIICHDKSKMDEYHVKALLKKWSKSKYWLECSEMHYKFIPPVIICERLLNGNMEKGVWMVPEDYKIFCFDGKAEIVMVCKDRFVRDYPVFRFFDKEWNEYSFSKEMLNKTHEKIEKPIFIDEMFELAEKLSKPFPFVRVDFYEENGKIIFGELTFTPSAGLDNDLPDEAEMFLGNKINL